MSSSRESRLQPERRQQYVSKIEAGAPSTASCSPSFHGYVHAPFPFLSCQCILCYTVAEDCPSPLSLFQLCLCGPLHIRFWPWAMNWTGGRLQRHSKANSNARVKAQRDYFARARLRQSTRPSAPTPLHISISAASHRQEQSGRSLARSDRKLALDEGRSRRTADD